MKKKIPTLALATLLASPAWTHAQDEKKRPDFESIRKRIEAAVESGDMTRDQANQKYAEIKKGMMASPAKKFIPAKKGMMDPFGKKGGPPKLMDRPAPQGPEPLKRLLGEMVKQDKLDEKSAARIYQAAFGNRPPSPP